MNGIISAEGSTSKSADNNNARDGAHNLLELQQRSPRIRTTSDAEQGNDGHDIHGIENNATAASADIT